MTSAENIGSMTAVTTAKALTVNGTNPVFEVSAVSENQTIAVADIICMMSATAEMEPDRILHRECPNAGVIIAADGIATFSATGVGTFIEDGGAIFKGMVLKTSASSLKSEWSRSCLWL